MPEAYQTPRTTNLAIPPDLRSRIQKSADADSRRLKPQTLILIEEALDARDRKAKK